MYWFVNALALAAKPGDLPAAAAVRINQLYSEADETNSEIEWSDAADFLQFITTSIINSKPDPKDEDDNYVSKAHEELCRAADELNAAVDLENKLARGPGVAPLDWAEIMGVTDLDPYKTLLALKNSPVNEDRQSRVMVAVRTVLDSSLAKLDGSVDATAPGESTASNAAAGGAAAEGAGDAIQVGHQSIESEPAARAAFLQFQALAEWLLERIANSEISPRLMDYPIPRALYTPPANEGAPARDPALALGLDSANGSDSDIDHDTLRAIGGGTQGGEAAVVRGHVVADGADPAPRGQAAVVKGLLVDTDSASSEDEQSVSSNGSEDMVVGRNSPVRALDSSSAQNSAQGRSEHSHRAQKVRGARRSAPAQQPLQPDPSGSMDGGASMFAPIPISKADQTQQELQPLLPSQGSAGSAQLGGHLRLGGSDGGRQPARAVAHPQRRPHAGILPRPAKHRGKTGPPQAKKNAPPGSGPHHRPPQGGPRRYSDSSDMSDGADPWEPAGGGQR